MAVAKLELTGEALTVASVSDLETLKSLTADELYGCCEVLEIRMDGLAKGGNLKREYWQHLLGFPLLFTARRQEEGGVMEADADTRASWIRTVLDDASLIDIEVASIGELSQSIVLMADHGVPWIASFHDFKQFPGKECLELAATMAKEAGAAVFKAAAMLANIDDLANLAKCQLILKESSGIPIALMGMGALAPVSRLLCAQSGCVLNYGFVGNVSTAPGQWDAATLKLAISKLQPFCP